MTKFYELLKQNHIYESQKLAKFIGGLEKKYKIVNAFEHYNALVNFSMNKNIPVHDWFKYREGFSGHLVAELISDSKLNASDIVVDPFVGSGTTLVEAVSNGYDAIGVDVNPMSALVAKVKSTSYSSKDISGALDYLDKIEKEAPKIEIKDIEDIAKYFPLNNYLNLKRIYCLLDKIRGTKRHDILFCAYLSIIEQASNRRRDGNGLKTVVTKNHDVLGLYRNKVLQIINDIQKTSAHYKAKSYVFAGSSANLSTFCKKVQKENGKSIGSIIFSPPYANSFDYFESYKLELWLGGFLTSKESLNQYRAAAVRSFIGGEKVMNANSYIKLLSQEVENAIPLKEKETNRRDARTRKVPQMLMGYFTDMSNIVHECYKSLRKGGRCYIVVDQSSYLGKVVPSDLLIAYFGEEHGFVVRQIIECRNAKTSGQQTQKYPYLKEILRESIVVLEKK